MHKAIMTASQPRQYKKRKWNNHERLCVWQYFFKQINHWVKKAIVIVAKIDCNLQKKDSKGFILAV